jgi:hypothetical protein
MSIETEIVEIATTIKSIDNQYKRLKEQYNYEDMKETLKTLLKECVELNDGVHIIIQDGVKVKLAYRAGRTSVDIKKLSELYPDVYNEVVVIGKEQEVLSIEMCSNGDNNND